MTIDLILFRQQVRRQRRRQLMNGLVLGGMVAALTTAAVWLFLHTAGSHLQLNPRIAFVVVPLLTGVLFLVVWVVTRSGGDLTSAMLHPGGAGMGPVPTSHAEFLARRGRWAESAAAFDALRATHGETVELLLGEADLHLGRGGNPQRARDLLIRVRQVADVTRADELYATQRLIDLYFGALKDQGRALTEMRRLVDRFPGTRDAEGAAAELARRRSASSST